MKKWRTIIMSDLHLGARQSQTKKILSFLEENESDILILNGDIIDGWALKSKGKWNKECSKIFRRFMKRSENGTKVIYIRGNHDDFLKPFVPFKMNNIEIVRKYVHIGLDGRKYFCFHGDVLDFVIMKVRWLAITIKQSVKGAINFVSDFESNAIGLTKQKGYDVSVCGHIHQPKLDKDYMNSGDFCENSTCLVEDFNGEWFIIDIRVYD